MDAEIGSKVEDYVNKVRSYIDGHHFPFTFILEDPSGNSFVQNPNAPNLDVYMKVDHYKRSYVDYVMMGFSAEQAQD